MNHIYLNLFDNTIISTLRKTKTQQINKTNYRNILIKMILYTLVSKGSMVLCEYSDLEGDFTEMARIVLKSLKPN